MSTDEQDIREDEKEEGQDEAPNDGTASNEGTSTNEPAGDDGATTQGPV
jgi:hypothetical protein